MSEKDGNNSKNQNDSGGETKETFIIKVKDWLTLSGPFNLIGAFLIGLLIGSIGTLYFVYKAPDILTGGETPSVNQTVQPDIAVYEWTSNGKAPVNPTLGGAYEVDRYGAIEIVIVNPSDESHYRWDEQTTNKGRIEFGEDNTYIVFSEMEESEGEIILTVCETDLSHYCIEGSKRDIRIVTE